MSASPRCRRRAARGEKIRCSPGLQEQKAAAGAEAQTFSWRDLQSVREADLRVVNLASFRGWNPLLPPEASIYNCSTRAPAGRSHAFSAGNQLIPQYMGVPVFGGL